MKSHKFRRLFVNPAKVDDLVVMGTPEGTIATIVETYLVMRKRGASDAEIFSSIEDFRHPKGEVPENVQIAGYVTYRVRLEHGSGGGITDSEILRAIKISIEFVTKLGEWVEEQKHEHGSAIEDAVAAYDPVGAIRSGNLADVRRFIHANPKSLDAIYEPEKWSLLHYLAALGRDTLAIHATMALELIRAGANVNCRTPLGWTPLIIIAMQGQKQAVSLAMILIEHGADVGAVDKNGLDWTYHWQHGEEIRRVLDAAMTPAHLRGR